MDLRKSVPELNCFSQTCLNFLPSVRPVSATPKKLPLPTIFPRNATKSSVGVFGLLRPCGSLGSARSLSSECGGKFNEKDSKETASAREPDLISLVNYAKANNPVSQDAFFRTGGK